MYTLICIFQDLAFFGLFILGCVWRQWELIVFPIIAFILVPFFNEIIYNLIAMLFYSEKRNKQYMTKYYNEILTPKNNKHVLPIVYDSRYNVTACGIEKMHPFDSVKYGRVFSALREKGFISEQGFIKPYGKVGRGFMLNQGVSQLYLLSLNYAVFISKCVEVPVYFLPASLLRWRVLDPMMYATQGSIDAAALAIKKGWSINLSGGYHHACRYKGGGFCIYPDICLAVEFVRKYADIKKCMIVDLDAHQGNGHERDYINDTQNTFIFDFYNHYIYPNDIEAKKGISYSKHCDTTTSDSQYLDMLEGSIIKYLDSFKPEFVLYNAGTDCLCGDRLGQMNLSSKAIIQRDEIVFSQCLKRNIPVTMVLSGGYQQSNAPIIAESILNLEKQLKISQHKRQNIL